MEIEPAPEPLPDNVISAQPRFEQWRALQVLYEQRGESALADDITFAARLLKMLGHPSQQLGSNYLGIVTRALDEPAEQSPDIMNPYHAIWRHLIEIVEEPLYDNLTLDRDNFATFFAGVKQALERKIDAGTEVSWAETQKRAVLALERLYKLTMIEPDADDYDLALVEKYVLQITHAKPPIQTPASPHLRIVD